jgi:hypothetical protein
VRYFCEGEYFVVTNMDIVFVDLHGSFGCFLFDGLLMMLQIRVGEIGNDEKQCNEGNANDHFHHSEEQEKYDGSRDDGEEYIHSG